MEQLYLVGAGIAHSKSPAMYNALYATLGLDWHYDAADLSTEREARVLLEGGAWLSANVTTPYKKLAFEAAQVKAASARLTGGANMLLARSGSVVGLNTDGVGCVRHIERAGHTFDGARVVVCGTGPTSMAILCAAAEAGAGRVALIGRDRGRSRAAMEGLLSRWKELAYSAVDLGPAREGTRSFRSTFEDTSFAFGSYATSTDEISSADIVVDATPLGMAPGDALPFPADLLGGQKLVYDVVYGHGDSLLLAAARDAGTAVLDGRGMLVAQAVENALLLLETEGVAGGMDAQAAWRIMADAAGFDIA